MRFTDYDISDQIKKALDEAGFKKPTDIQFRAIPSILRGEDVMAIAQTGTGKTAAFAIPVLHVLQARARRRGVGVVRCLVMVPTRELAIQIGSVFHSLAQYTGLAILELHGGVEQAPQIEELKEGVDILVATPGRMYDLMAQGVLDIRTVEILVLDEADLMLDLGFYKDIQGIIGRLPKKHQTLFFSATLNPKIKDLAYSVIANPTPIRIQISPKDPVSKNVTHSVLFVEMDDKRAFLERLVKENPESRILVFVRTKVRSERVQAALKRMGIESLAMHGGKEQEDRLQVLQDFKEGIVKVMITTDVSARGIHIDNVDFVVNYDMPEVPESYVHRVGRTGRGIHKGTALAFCATEEKPLLEAIEKAIGRPIEITEVDKGEYKTILSLTEDVPNTNWQALIDEDEKAKSKVKRKKSKK